MHGQHIFRDIDKHPEHTAPDDTLSLCGISFYLAFSLFFSPVFSMLSRILFSCKIRVFRPPVLDRLDERTDNDLKRALPARAANGCSFSVLFHFLYSVIHPLCFPAIIAHEQIPDDESYR